MSISVCPVYLEAKLSLCKSINMQTDIEEFKPRLLVVDDELTIAVMIADIAKKLGYNAFVLTDSRQFEIIYQFDYEVIVVDLVMPSKDGIELIRHLAHRQSPAQLILMSGFDAAVLNTAHALATAHGLNVVQELQKPFRIEQLEAILTECLSKDKQKFRSKDGAITIATGDITSGISRGEFMYYYQPQIKLNSGEVVGFEALARWRHPWEGVISPVHFISLAEKANLIEDLTWQLLRCGLQDFEMLHEHFPDCTLAVNLSPILFNDLTLPDRVLSLTKDYGIVPNQLVLEITESAVMNDSRRSLDIIARFRMKGFRISIDDFGTGASIYERLRHMPITEIKIDRAFVADFLTSKKSQAIVENTIKLGHGLGLQVVAEGIETQETANALRAMNCDLAQGYLYSPPVSLEKACSSLRQQILQK